MTRPRARDLPPRRGSGRADLRYRVAMRRLAWAIAAIAASTVAACRSAPKVEEPDAAIVGSWRSTNGVATFTFSRGGLYELRLADKPRPVMGAFTYSPKEGTLVLHTRRESSVCGDDVGTYNARLGAMTLDLELVRDTCDVRANALAKPLARIGPGTGGPR